MKRKPSFWLSINDFLSVHLTLFCKSTLERDICDRILYRTVKWGVLEELISTRAFLKGYKTVFGQFPPLNCTPESFRRSRSLLVSRGVIFYDEERYSVNIQGIMNCVISMNNGDVSDDLLETLQKLSEKYPDMKVRSLSVFAKEKKMVCDEVKKVCEKKAEIREEKKKVKKAIKLKKKPMHWQQIYDTMALECCDWFNSPMTSDSLEGKNNPETGEPYTMEDKDFRVKSILERIQKERPDDYMDFLLHVARFSKLYNSLIAYRFGTDIIPEDAVRHPDLFLINHYRKAVYLFYDMEKNNEEPLDLSFYAYHWESSTTSEEGREYVEGRERISRKYWRKEISVEPIKRVQRRKDTVENKGFAESLGIKRTTIAV